MPTGTIGEIDGVDPGDTFPSRQALHDAGVHRPLQAGICGTPTSGAESIVISGGYADDRDHGSQIIYTGEGGRNAATGRQYAHQELTPRNASLVYSQRRKLPVRVIRKSKNSDDYEYLGLYWVTSHSYERGQDGFHVYRFILTPWAESAPSNEQHASEPRT